MVAEANFRLFWHSQVLGIFFHYPPLTPPYLWCRQCSQYPGRLSQPLLVPPAASPEQQLGGAWQYHLEEILEEQKAEIIEVFGRKGRQQSKTGDLVVRRVSFTLLKHPVFQVAQIYYCQSVRLGWPPPAKCPSSYPTSSQPLGLNPSDTYFISFGDLLCDPTNPVHDHNIVFNYAQYFYHEPVYCNIFATSISSKNIFAAQLLGLKAIAK